MQFKFAAVMNNGGVVLPELTDVTLEGNRQTHCSFDPLMLLPARSFMRGNGKICRISPVNNFPLRK